MNFRHETNVRCVRPLLPLQIPYHRKFNPPYTLIHTGKTFFVIILDLVVLKFILFLFFVNSVRELVPLNYTKEKNYFTENQAQIPIFLVEYSAKTTFTVQSACSVNLQGLIDL